MTSFASRILVPTDFSETSEVAVEAAAILAKQNDAEVVLVHVHDPAPLAPVATRTVDGTKQFDIENDIEKAIYRALDELEQNKLQGVRKTHKTLLLGSNAADAICSHAEKEKVDLIALATHGRTGLGHLLIGSVAEKVVRHAPCPVLTLRSRLKDTTATPSTPV